jgi:hypothetical protein
MRVFCISVSIALLHLVVGLDVAYTQAINEPVENSVYDFLYRNAQKGNIDLDDIVSKNGPSVFRVRSIGSKRRNYYFINASTAFPYKRGFKIHSPNAGFRKMCAVAFGSLARS